jgi:DnaJ domain
MATDGLFLRLSEKESWKTLYRKFIGILPGEEKQTGYGCINGINIFNYFYPRQVFNLDSSTATTENIKQAYRNLSKIYHPDVPITGDNKVFDRINQMYKSLVS